MRYVYLLDIVTSQSKSNGLVNTVSVTLIIFSVLIIIFEIVRVQYKKIYASRTCVKKLKAHKRVPPRLSKYPFVWMYDVINIPEQECLRMIGLDGYMLLRYINICFRFAAFCSFWGLVCLVPLYSSATDSSAVGWDKYTLANLGKS